MASRVGAFNLDLMLKMMKNQMERALMTRQTGLVPGQGTPGGSYLQDLLGSNPAQSKASYY